MSTGSESGKRARRVTPSGIALIVMLPVTAGLVAMAMLHTSAPPVSTSPASPAVATSSQPSPTSSAGAVNGLRVVAFLGDSTASGTGASKTSKRWTTVVSVKQGWTEKNLSQTTSSYSTAGETDGTSYTARLDAVVATNAQIVVVSGGRNDVDVSTTQFRADVRATFAGIRVGLPQAKIIVISPIWDNLSAPDRMTALTAIVKSEANRVGATYLDIGEPMFGHSSMLTFDGVHPNNSGHAAIATAVDKALT